jgi:hypothetical protein
MDSEEHPQQRGPLFNEFDQIFHDIFTRKAETYRTIVLALIDGPCSITEIGKAIRRGRGGSLSEALEDLESAGFLSQIVALYSGSSSGAKSTVQSWLKSAEKSKAWMESPVCRSAAA